MNCLILLTDIPLKAQMASVKLDSNKAQIKAITSLKIDKFVWIKYGSEQRLHNPQSLVLGSPKVT